MTSDKLRAVRKSLANQSAISGAAAAAATDDDTAVAVAVAATGQEVAATQARIMQRHLAADQWGIGFPVSWRHFD